MVARALGAATSAAARPNDSWNPAATRGSVDPRATARRRAAIIGAGSSTALRVVDGRRRRRRRGACGAATLRASASSSIAAWRLVGDARSPAEERPRPRRTAGPRSWSSPRRRAPASAGPRRGSRRRSAGARARIEPARAAHTAAIRHGSRIAATPPGIGDRPQMADALEARRSRRPAPRHPTASRRAHSRGRRTRRRSPARCGRARPCTRRHARGGAAPRPSGGRGRRANFVDRYSGWRSCATTSGRTPYSAGRWSTAWRNDGTSRGARGRRGDGSATTVGALRHRDRRLELAHRPRGSMRLGLERQRQRFRARSRASGGGAASAVRGGPARPSRRSGCGSAGRGQQTVDERRRGASPRRRRSWAIGSSLRLPLVITSGRPTPPSSRWCNGVYGSITPSSGSPGATASATDASCRRGASTIGRRGEVELRRPSRRRARRAAAAASRSADHDRERLVVAGLAAAQLAHGFASVASTARW